MKELREKFKTPTIILGFKKMNLNILNRLNRLNTET